MSSSDGNDLGGLRQALRALQRMMDGHSVRVAELVQDRGGNVAAVRRRLRALEAELRHVHRDDPGRGKPETFWWTWPSAERARPEQVWALAAARAMLHAFREGEIGRVLSDLVQEFAGRLDAGPSRLGPAVPDRMFFTSSRLANPVELEPDLVDRLAKAISARRLVQAKYEQFSGAVLRTRVEPWTLIFADEGVYLYGMCVDCDKDAHVGTRRIYNVTRLSELKQLEEGFVYPLPEDYDPASEFRHSFGIFVPRPGDSPTRVVLRFGSGWGTYLRRHRLHPAQVGPAVPHDGRYVVKMDLYITYDLVRWVRGHGRELEVMEPAALAKWVESGDGARGLEKYVPVPDY